MKMAWDHESLFSVQFKRSGYTRQGLVLYRHFNVEMFMLLNNWLAVYTLALKPTTALESLHYSNF